jgi:hypothetical protein
LKKMHSQRDRHICISIGRHNAHRHALGAADRLSDKN